MNAWMLFLDVLINSTIFFRLFLLTRGSCAKIWLVVGSLLQSRAINRAEQTNGVGLVV